MDRSSPAALPDYLQSHMTLLVRLKVPSRALLAAASSPDSKPLHAASPFPPSSPPTLASSPAPGGPPPAKKRRGQKSRPGPAPGSGVFSLNQEGGGSGAATPVPAPEKERAKPGPKANPGGINAGLRALDRSGRPTRRWQKVSYPVHSLSGYTFHAVTWISPPGMSMQRVQTDCLVAGDAFLEHRSKTQTTERWHRENADGEGPVELGQRVGDAVAV
jgi:hypothetical protein